MVKIFIQPNKISTGRYGLPDNQQETPLIAGDPQRLYVELRKRRWDSPHYFREI